MSGRAETSPRRDRHVDRFVADVLASLAANRHQRPAAVWPRDGDLVAESMLSGPVGAAAGLAEDLARLLGGTVTATVTRPPVTGGAEALVLPLRGGCRVDAGGGFDIRLRAGEVAYVPRGRGYACTAPRGGCRLVVLHLDSSPRRVLGAQGDRQ